RPRLLHFSAVGSEDDFVTRRRAFLAADTGEGGPDPVIAVLRPAFERVVMAFRTLDADAEKQLRNGFGGIERIAARAPEAGGGVLEHTPGAGEQFAGELVHRDVGLDTVGNPLVEFRDPFRPQRTAGGAENIGPFQT